MAKGPIRIGIIGAGAWACAAHLPSLQGHPQVKLAVVANRSRETAEAAAKRFGIAEVVDDWKALVARADVDAVVVTTPAHTHKSIVLSAIEQGKHVLCEGSLAMTAAEGREMLGAAEAAGLVHAYIRPRPYLSGGEQVRKLLDDDAIGQIHSALFTWRGNPWLQDDPAESWRVRHDTAPPLVVGIPVAIVETLLGPITRIQATVRRLHTQQNAAPDYFAGLLKTAARASVVIQAGWSSQAPPGNGLQVFGTGGTLVWDWTRMRILCGATGADMLMEMDYVPEPDLAKAWPFTRSFVDAIVSGNQPDPDFRTGVRELELIEAVQHSARTGERVDRI